MTKDTDTGQELNAVSFKFSTFPSNSYILSDFDFYLYSLGMIRKEVINSKMKTGRITMIHGLAIKGKIHQNKNLLLRIPQLATRKKRNKLHRSHKGLIVLRPAAFHYRQPTFPIH